MALNDDLEVADSTSVRAIGVKWQPMRDECLPDLLTHLIDEGVMDWAIRDVNDAVSAELEDADLGLQRATAHREARTVAEPRRSAFVHERRWETCALGERFELCARGGRDAGDAEARATGARRAMGAVKIAERRHARELDAKPVRAPKQSCFS